MVQEEIYLEDEVNTHGVLKDKDVIQEMGEYKYHEEDPTTISEYSDEEVKEKDDMTIKDDTDK